MTSPEPRVTHHLVERKVGDLWVDQKVQRVLNRGRVERIAAQFNPDALGVLTTSFRDSSSIAIIDGQHRYRAAELAGYTGPIRTTEYRGLTIPQEAALFRQLNSTAKPTAVDSFLVSCVEENPDSLAMAKIIADNGWTLSNATATGRMSAIGSLQKVYALSPAAAAGSIAAITSAWGHSAAGIQGPLIEGIGRMLHRYGTMPDGLVDLKDLAAKLAAYPGGPASLLGYARGQSLARVGNSSHVVAWAVTSLYNQRRRATALPPWQ
jgi:hypothetical protein